MAGQNSASTLDGLKKMVGEIAQLQLLPDSVQHGDFLAQLQMGITKYVQQAMSNPGGQPGQPQGPGQNPPGGPQVPPGASPQGPPSGLAGGQMGGGMQGLTPPNMDELRRVLSAGGQTQ